MIVLGPPVYQSTAKAIEVETTSSQRYLCFVYSTVILHCQGNWRKRLHFPFEKSNHFSTHCESINFLFECIHRIQYSLYFSFTFQYLSCLLIYMRSCIVVYSNSFYKCFTLVWKCLFYANLFDKTQVSKEKSTNYMYWCLILRSLFVIRKFFKFIHFETRCLKFYITEVQPHIIAELPIFLLILI